MTLPGASSIPATDANHIRMASNAVAASLTWFGRISRRRRSRPKAFENAITVAMAMGCRPCSHHPVAQARRAGQDVGLDDFEKASREVP